MLERIFDYHFSSESTYPTRARVRLEPLADRVRVHEVEFTLVPVKHGEMDIRRLSFRRRRLPHGCERNPGIELCAARRPETLVLPSLRHHPHPSHATVKQAVEWAERIGARQTWLTHIAHELGHEATNASCLPAWPWRTTAWKWP